MKVISILILLVMCGSAFAGGFLDSGTHSWSDPGNWIDGTVPDYLTGVIGGQRNGDICNIVSGDNAVCSYLYWGWTTPNPATTIFNVSGTGTLTVAGDLCNGMTDSNNTSYMN
jgi:hypothetical protein